ncbi:hypothetical protein MTR_7g089165 [Medicago truncatula]|uniref:Uncharacterized protein n=1 Tax=Medicago truncatula TaxID=3880 RepID=A0A072U1N1_MEDTR|nr:hypothetical protein MTR_7g089165 [Medicago truncatula]
MNRLGSDGYATAGTESLDLGAKSKSPEIFDGEYTWNDVFTEEIRNRARKASVKRSIKGSKNSERTGPSRGSGGCSVGE